MLPYLPAGEPPVWSLKRPCSVVGNAADLRNRLDEGEAHSFGVAGAIVDARFRRSPAKNAGSSTPEGLYQRAKTR